MNKYYILIVCFFVRTVSMEHADSHALLDILQTKFTIPYALLTKAETQVIEEFGAAPSVVMLGAYGAYELDDFRDAEMALSKLDRLKNDNVLSESQLHDLWIWNFVIERVKNGWFDFKTSSYLPMTTFFEEDEDDADN